MIHQLVLEVAELLREAASGLGFNTPLAGGEEGYLPPNIFLFDPPAKESHVDPEHYPLVVIRASDGQAKETEGRGAVDTVNLELICGVHQKEGKEAGLQDLLGLVGLVRRTLWARPLLAERYQLDPALAWTVSPPEEQRPPFYLAAIEANYSYPIPQPGPPLPQEKVNVYGAGYPDQQ
ncbi:MAG: hypothetical protein KQJ78_14765 [Deltaproteobacteria bacterium]|nr:hypothetical protein [Deltaproteobacteria bacterium]